MAQINATCRCRYVFLAPRQPKDAQKCIKWQTHLLVHFTPAYWRKTLLSGLWGDWVTAWPCLYHLGLHSVYSWPLSRVSAWCGNLLWSLYLSVSSSSGVLSFPGYCTVKVTSFIHFLYYNNLFPSSEWFHVGSYDSIRAQLFMVIVSFSRSKWMELEYRSSL